MTDRSNLVEGSGENNNFPLAMTEYGLFVNQSNQPDVELIQKLSYLGQSSSEYGECDPDTNDQNSVTNCKV